MTAHTSARSSSPLRSLKRASVFSSAIVLGLAAAACGGSSAEDEAELPPPFSNGNATDVNPVQPGSNGAGIGQNTNATGNGGQGFPTTSPNQVAQGANSENNSANLPIDNSQNNAGNQNGGTGGSAGVDDSQVDNTQNGAGGGAMAGTGGSTFDGAGGGELIGAGGGAMDADDNPQDNGQQQPPAADIACPADASFCSGFEGTGLPADANWEPAYENFQIGQQASLDTNVVRSGNQSISVSSAGGYSYNMITVPVPGQAFWARLYMQVDSVFGDNSHDTPFMASTLPVGEYNGDTAAEFSEQGNQVLLNQNDALYSANGPGFPQGNGPTLPANTWICMEGFFDGGSGDVQIYADGQLLLDAPNFNSVNYQTFRFGYLSFNDARTVWYDDVVVASSRIGCN